MPQPARASFHPEVAALVEAMQRRHRADVNRYAASLLQSGIMLGKQWAAVARALAHNGEITLALHASERAIVETDRAPSAQFEHAVLLARIGRSGEACATARKIAPGAIDVAQLDHFIGTCAMEMQDFDEAKRCFEAVLARRPGSGATWVSLVSIADAGEIDQLWDRLNAADAAVDSARPEERAAYLYARGAARQGRGDIDRAFTDFAAGAALIASLRPFDAAADQRQIEALIAHAPSPRHADWQPDPRAPIFVLGHPRSGTTLVEQILADTGGAVAGGELNLMRIVADEAGGLAASRAQGRERDLRGLLDHLLTERLGMGARAIDKSLNNSRYLGLITAIAPGAPIIRVRRRAVDAAWSCFRTYFSQGVPWSWSLDTIISYFRAEERLLSFWAERLGAQMLVIDYEELVAQPNMVAERLVDHCAFEIPADLARPMQPIRTASVAQARRPITERAVGAAEPYRAHLATLYDALGN